MALKGADNMKSAKCIVRIVCAVCALGIAAAGLAACKRDKPPKGDSAYLDKVGSYSFWSNSPETSIPEYNTYHHVHDFLDECEIIDANAVAPDGRIRKVLFIGFDGMRADALPYVLNVETAGSSAYNSKTNVSAIGRVASQGGIYLAYCGGETGSPTQQTTSTSASWTSHFTGVWGSEHGIKTNDDKKNMKHKTFMLEYAEKGLNTTVAFDWDQFFDVNLAEEIKYVMDNSLPMTFCDTDRARSDKLGKSNAETLEMYNFAAAQTPSLSAPYDSGMRDYVLDRMEKGDDVIAAIFHNIDSAGHEYGFGTSTQYTGAVINCDLYANSILNAVEERQRNYNEEWLVVFANDHGGIGTDHGNQTLEERTTWIATNKIFDEKYFSARYNGYKAE